MEVEEARFKDLTIFTISGKFDAAAGIDSVVRYNTGQPTFKTIFDFRKVDFSEANDLKIRYISEKISPAIKRKGKTAIIGKSINDEIMVYMKTYMEIFKTQIEFKICTSIDEAKLWLDG